MRHGGRHSTEMNQRIPNTVHFVFGLREQTRPFHLMHYLCLRSCLEVWRPDTVHIHLRHKPFGPLWEAIRPLVVLRQVPDTLAIPPGKPEFAAYRYAHEADVLRLQILVSEGGIYADMDTLFLAPLPPALLQEACVMGRERPPVPTLPGSLCNALIAAEPGSAFCREWLEQLPRWFDGSWSNHSTVLPYQLSQRLPQLVHVEPEERFFALDWTPAHLADLFENQVALPDRAVSLHLWAHLWFGAARRDFSLFSADLLTADYVAFARTTYARHACNFLPPGPRPSRARYLLQQARLGRRRLRQQVRALLAPAPGRVARG